MSGSGGVLPVAGKWFAFHDRFLATTSAGRMARFDHPNQNPFAPTRPSDVYGSLPFSGPPKSVEEMDAGVASEARRRGVLASEAIGEDGVKAPRPEDNWDFERD